MLELLRLRSELRLLRPLLLRLGCMLHVLILVSLMALGVLLCKGVLVGVGGRRLPRVLSRRLILLNR